MEKVTFGRIETQEMSSVVEARQENINELLQQSLNKFGNSRGPAPIIFFIEPGLASLLTVQFSCHTAVFRSLG
jgi:hypothetical protein